MAADRPARRRRTYGAGAIQSSWPTARDAARTDGESDPIDALAVTRAAVRQDDLPAAHLDGPDLDLRLLVDHREDLIAERTRTVNRLRPARRCRGGWLIRLGPALPATVLASWLRARIMQLRVLAKISSLSVPAVLTLAYTDLPRSMTWHPARAAGG